MRHTFFTALASAAALCVSLTAQSEAQSGASSDCLMQARAYCAYLSSDRLAYYECVLAQYEACLGSVTQTHQLDAPFRERHCEIA